MKKNNNEKGFSLVELLVVVIIIAIVAAIAIPNLIASRKAAAEAATASTLRTIHSAEVTFSANNNGAYTDGPGLRTAGLVDTNVGQATFVTSLDCLSLRGLLVSFGNASGPVAGVELGILASKGSLYVTRPTLGSYIGTEAEMQETADDLIDVVQSGKVKIPVNQRYALADVVQAHRDLAARKTTGTTVLIP